MIDSQDKLLRALAYAEITAITFDPTMVTSSNQIFSLWRDGRVFPGVAPAEPPSGGEICDRNTPGALPFRAAVAGEELRLLEASLFQTGSSGTILIYDRLWHDAGHVGSPTEVAVNSDALTRYTTGEDLEMFFEYYAGPMTGNSGLTVNFTDESDVARSVSPPTFTPSTVGRMLHLSSYVDDAHGVKSIDSYQNSNTNWAVGSFGFTIAKRIAAIPAGEGNRVQATKNAFDLGMPRVLDDACLFCVLIAPATSVPGGFADLMIGPTT